MEYIYLVTATIPCSMWGARFRICLGSDVDLQASGDKAKKWSFDILFNSKMSLFLVHIQPGLMVMWRACVQGHHSLFWFKNLYEGEESLSWGDKEEGDRLREVVLAPLHFQWPLCCLRQRSEVVEKYRISSTWIEMLALISIDLG